MLQWLSDYMNQSGFVPHGVCMLWRPELLWTHVFADGLIALAYFVIPMRLMTLAASRPDAGYRGTLWLFSAFILLCGTTHVVGLVTIWEPIYGIEAAIKTVTAIVSLITAAWLIPLIPRLIEIPSPAQLRERNEALAAAVAERDALLAEVHGHRAELERLVEARTHELSKANASLARVNAGLERSNQELEHFASVASHDLQEPVRKILTFLDLARPRLRDEDEGKGFEYLTRVESAARRMHRLIHDLLTLSRIGHDDPDTEPVDLKDMLESLVADQQDSLRAVGARVEIAGDPAIIATQPVLLRQVFVNLVGNAVKYRRPDEPLRIGIRTRVLATGALQIVVSDNGRGFDKQDAAHLFRLFRRLGHDRDVGGTGIGLALCRKIVEHLGGRIEAAGEVDAGATFTVTLPPSATDHARRIES
jgi:signal transduction histidine kinase